MQLFELTAKKKKIKLILDYEKNVPYVIKSDPHRIK